MSVREFDAAADRMRSELRHFRNSHLILAPRANGASPAPYLSHRMSREDGDMSNGGQGRSGSSESTEPLSVVGVAVLYVVYLLGQASSARAADADELLTDGGCPADSGRSRRLSGSAGSGGSGGSAGRTLVSTDSANPLDAPRRRQG
eukprot:gene17095-9236_t